jgi:hypothetical protein
MLGKPRNDAVRDIEGSRNGADELAESRHLIASCAVGFGFPLRRQVSLFSYISEEKVSPEESEGPLEGL